MAQRKPKKLKKPAKSNKLEGAVSPRSRAGRQAEPKPHSSKSTEPPDTGEELAGAIREASASDTVRFPVVVIGASAGGLAALEPFFEHVPRDSGMAFVVVTHNRPTTRPCCPSCSRATPRWKPRPSSREPCSPRTACSSCPQVTGYCSRATRCSCKRSTRNVVARCPSTRRFDRWRTPMPSEAWRSYCQAMVRTARSG